MQLALARLGYPLRGSGSFGGATLSAVKDFQKARGLEVDGEIGAETAKALDVALAELQKGTVISAVRIAEVIGGHILRKGDTGPLVQELQRRLAQLGYPLKGTGNFGTVTDNAVRDFQAHHSLDVDGEVGPQVAEALDRAVVALAQRNEAAAQGNATGAGPQPYYTR